MFFRPRPHINVCMVSSSFMVSTYRLSCEVASAIWGTLLAPVGTHDLIDHDQDARLGMLHGLHVAVDGAAQAGVGAGVDVAIEAGRLDVGLLGVQDEDVGAGGFGDEIELVEDGALELLRGAVDDEIRVDVDEGRPLCVWLAELPTQAFRFLRLLLLLLLLLLPLTLHRDKDIPVRWAWW